MHNLMCYHSLHYLTKSLYDTNVAPHCIVFCFIVHHDERTYANAQMQPFLYTFISHVIHLLGYLFLGSFGFR